MTTLKQRENLIFRAHKMMDRRMSNAAIGKVLGLSHETIAEYRKSHIKPEEKTNVTPPPYMRGYRWGAGW